MTDLRKSFLKTLTNYGHNIYLQRRISPFGSEDVEFEDSLEKHTVRYTYPGLRGAGGVAEERPVGVTHDAEMIYYFQHNANPREGDRIYENLEEYPDDLVTWIVDYVIPMRMLRGRIEYWTVGASKEPLGE